MDLSLHSNQIQTTLCSTLMQTTLGVNAIVYLDPAGLSTLLVCCLFGNPQKHGCTSHSDAEAECIFLSEYSLDIKCTISYIEELGISKVFSSQLLSDNKSANVWAERESSMQKAKHNEIRYHYVRHLVSSNVIKTIKILSKKNIADMLTKPLDKILFSKFRDRHGMADTRTRPQGRGS